MALCDILLAQKLGGSNASKSMISDAYDSTKTYAVGDYCIYNNTLYICKTAITTAEEWTPAHWDATNCTTELSELKGTLIDKITYIDLGNIEGNDSKTIITNIFEAITVYDVPIIARFTANGKGIAFAYKYTGGNNGEMFCLRFGYANLFSFIRNNGSDTVTYYTGTSYT
jgi:hypothetical protein